MLARKHLGERFAAIHAAFFFLLIHLCLAFGFQFSGGKEALVWIELSIFEHKLQHFGFPAEDHKI
jgi:hypothetical protein